MPRNVWAAPPPRWLTPTTVAERRRGDGALYADLIDATCRITKDSVAGGVGELLVMRPWQRQLLTRVFARRADGRLKHRVALVGTPRKNGKSELGAGVAVGSMLLGPEGGEIYSAAADKDQASIIFRTAKRMIEMDPNLSALIKVYRNVLEVPATGTIYKALSAEAYTKEGLNPTVVLFDELHAQPTSDLWNVLQLAGGARVEPLILAITTAGVRTDRTGLDSVCYRLYQHGVAVAKGEKDDPTFFMAWWEPHEGASAPHDSPATWRESNPGFGDLIGQADFASVLARGTEENEFRIKRTNQWVASGKVWLPAGTWEACADPNRYPKDPGDPLDRAGWPPPGTKVCLGFDGSLSGDSTVIVGVTVDAKPHVFLVGAWEKDPYDPDWRVPRAEVKEAYRDADARWDNVEGPWDDSLWGDAFEELKNEGLKVEAYPQSPERMGKATQLFYEAVVDGALTHANNPVLNRHIANAVPKPTSRGLSRIVKATPDSPRKIDGAVTAVFTHDRAAWWANKPVERPFNIW